MSVFDRNAARTAAGSARRLAFVARGTALLVFGVGGAGLVVSCAPKNSQNSYVLGCQLPANQSGTLSGHWAVRAVPITLHAGDWNNAEGAQISAAADTWNSFYSATTGSPLITMAGASSAPKPSALCSQSIVSGTQFKGSVVVYKDSVWPYPSLPNAIALTTFCPSPARPLNNFYMAIVEVNYQNFFVSGRKVPDLQTILTHEFGHLAGLNHSCESSGSAGVPACGSASADYTSAVMAPVFAFNKFGFGQVKQQLTENDQGRANCLYPTTQ